MNENNSIGSKIVILRAGAGWTQQQLAEKLNTSQRTVAAWESGDAVPRKTMQVKIARLFDLPENYFLQMPSEDGKVKAEEDAAQKKLMQALDKAFAETGITMTEEKKSLFVNSLQDVLDIKK